MAQGACAPRMHDLSRAPSATLVGTRATAHGTRGAFPRIATQTLHTTLHAAHSPLRTLPTGSANEGPWHHTRAAATATAIGISPDALLVRGVLLSLPRRCRS